MLWLPSKGRAFFCLNTQPLLSFIPFAPFISYTHIVNNLQDFIIKHNKNHIKTSITPNTTPKLTPFCRLAIELLEFSRIKTADPTYQDRLDIVSLDIDFEL